MIRYSISLTKLKSLIELEQPGWLKRAGDRTEGFRRLGSYSEASTIWGEIKRVYMTLQHEKCAYCERRLAGPTYGSVEHDMEHFRPKSSVAEWPTAAISKDRGILYGFGTGASQDPGYYLLAYHPLNYATACKTCNGPLKSNFFPIGGTRNTSAERPADAKSEKPYLLFPVGNHDTDPETILTFEGHLPRPVYKSGRKFWRATVIVDFFELATREELLRERADLIAKMWIGLSLLRSNAPQAARDFTRDVLERVSQPSSPHSSCAKAFKKLYAQDLVRAEAVADTALLYLNSQS